MLNKKSLLIIVVVAAVVLVFWWWSSRQASEQAEVLLDTTDISQDLNALDVNNLDSELKDIDQNLNSL